MQGQPLQTEGVFGLENEVVGSALLRMPCWLKCDYKRKVCLGWRVRWFGLALLRLPKTFPKTETETAKTGAQEAWGRRQALEAPHHKREASQASQSSIGANTAVSLGHAGSF